MKPLLDVATCLPGGKALLSSLVYGEAGEAWECGRSLDVTTF